MPLSSLPRVPIKLQQGPTAGTAKLIVLGLGLLILAADIIVPADYDVSEFYVLPIAACVWSGSRRFLWVATSLFTGLAVVGQFFNAPASADRSLVEINRIVGALGLLVIAVVAHYVMKNLATLEAQRRLTGALVETVDQAQVIIRKLDGAILFWSQGAERLYGWSGQEAVGQITHELFGSDLDAGQLKDVERQLLRDGEWIGELRHVRKDGTPMWVASHWTVRTNGLFDHPVVTEVNNDITRVKSAEDRFRKLTEAIPHLVWQTSAAGRTTYVNQRWQEYFGRAESELAGPTVAELVHPEDTTGAIARWEKAILTGHMEPWEVRYRRHDGVYRWFSGRAVAVRNETDQITNWIGTATDIDDEKKTADHLRQSQKIESIGRLAGGVAHDLNNLLTVITGYSEFLDDETAGNPAAAGYNLQIKNATERAAALTTQLLAFSRPQLAKPRNVDLNHVVNDISKILGRVIGEDIKLLVSLQRHLPDVLADPVHLDQIIMNLAVNARDAMPDGGSLWLATATAAVEEVQARQRGVRPGTFVTLKVADSGIGIDEATMAQIFEPFFTTKEKGKGTGLGLSIVYGLVAHFGGFITVESKLGAGTEFAVYLPVSTALESPEPAKPVEQHSMGDGETILVIEDEESVRNLVRETLEKRGYSVLAASTPRLGIELARQHSGKVDLLISDVLMPEMRGPELVNQILKFLPNISVLYMSGYSDSTFLDASVIDGSFYIQKPFQPGQLAEIVAKTLKGRADSK